MRVRDFSDLIQQLTTGRAVVDRRGDGRTTEQTETWVMHRLVPTLAHLGFVQFPAGIFQEDRPDLRLELPSGNVGVEVTEVVPPTYAKADAIRNQHYPNAVVDRSIFTWGATFTAKEIHDHLSRVGRDLTGPGWAGDSVEREWAAAMNEAIKTKIEKLNRAGFTLCKQNWLAAYSSSPGPALKMSHAAKFLDLPLAVAGQRSFDCVFALTDGCASERCRG